MKRFAEYLCRVSMLILGLIFATQARAVVLWSHYDTMAVNENGAGADILGGAVKRDDAANDTLYFKFRVEPISDETTEPYFAGVELFDDDTERFGVGNALDAWAYSVFFPQAQTNGAPKAGYLDLRTAHPDPDALARTDNYQYPRRGEPVTIVFKVQYVPNGDDLVTIWLNPDLGPGANEVNQSESLTTRVSANAAFDELRLRHGGQGGGWKFSEMAIGTAFNDFVDLSSDRPDIGETSMLQREGSLQFQSWLKNQGIPRLPVGAIQQTKDGYLWIATRGQVTRFDGLKFVSFDEPATGTNFYQQVLLADNQGALWFASPKGLQRRQNGHPTLLTTNNGLPSGQITALNEDATGRIWIGTESGLAIWNDGRLETPANLEPLRDRPITSIFKDQSGVMWLVVQGREIFQFSQNRLSPVSPDNTMDSPSGIQELLVDKTGRLWLGTDENAVLCLDKDGWHRYRIPKHVTGSGVRAMAEEPDGTIWAGGASGLFVFSDGKFSAIPASSQLAGHAVESLFVDSDGALWAGTDEGLNRLEHKSLFSFGQAEGLGFGPVQGLAQVSRGVIWAARTGDGIYRWDGRSFSRLRAAGLAAHNSQARALLVTHDSACWVASDGGLLRYKDPVAAEDEVRWFELPGEEIISLAESPEGSLWAGTRAGKLWQLCEGKWIALDSITISNAINAILPAQDGSLWLGTEGSGLIHLVHNRAEFFGTGTGLPSESICALYLDIEGVLWIGTARGLGCRRDDKISNFTVPNGLPNSPVSQILEDDSERLWLGTSQGIVYVRKTQLQDFAAGRLQALHPKIFNRSDGMVSDECVGNFCPAGLKSHLGLLWFPTTRGIAIIAPQNWPLERPMTAAVIEEIRLDGVPVSADSISSELRIPPGRHRLELAYTGLHFSSPELLKFRYKLEGWDPDWVDAGASRSAVYNLVPPGQYSFKVIACNSDGTWAPSGAELRLNFARYFWQSGWFISIASIALLGAVGGTVRIIERQRSKARLQRIERERALERERTRIAQDLHDEMGAKLCRILFLSAHAGRGNIQPAELQEQIKSISDDSREVLHSLDEIVWAVNPQNDTLEHAASYLAQFARDYFSMTGLECELIVPAQMPAYPVSSQVRHHLFLAVRESLANTLKHSSATHVTVSMACQNGTFEVKVEDNGKGFTPETKTVENSHAVDTHDGLRNMAGRLADVGGQCFVESRAGTGTIVRFLLPVKHQS
ncbi:MAG: histidine kinase [Verrucomicrobia bacterium]|nr:histidine kinase [Verrucomicrobiota bacterium]